MAFALIVLAIGSVVGGLRRAAAGARRLEPARALSRAELRRRRRLEEVAGARRSKLTLMVVSIAVAVAGIGIAVYFFLKNRARGRRVAERFAGVHRLLAEQVLRRRDLRRRHRAADSHRLRGRAVEGRRRRASSTAPVNGVGETVAGSERAAAAAADRLGPHLRRVAVPRRGADPGVLLVALNDQSSQSLCVVSVR